MYIKSVNAEGRQAVALHEELFGRLHTALEAKDVLQGIAFKVRSLVFVVSRAFRTFVALVAS